MNIKLVSLPTNCTLLQRNKGYLRVSNFIFNFLLLVSDSFQQMAKKLFLTFYEAKVSELNTVNIQIILKTARKSWKQLSVFISKCNDI